MQENNIEQSDFRKTQNKYIFITKVLSLVFIIQFVLLICANLFFIKCNLDADSAVLFDHAIEIYNNKSFFIDGWQNATTLEFDSALFFAVFLYGITNNICISFGISNILMGILYIWAICILAKNIGLKKLFTYIILILLFIPYRLGQLEYFNMMFFVGGQYGMKVLIPLMLLAIMTLPKGRKQYFFEILYYLFLLLTSCSSGIYVFIAGVIPVLMCEFLYDLKNKQKLNKLRVFILSFCMFVIGSIIAKTFSNDIKSFDMILTDMNNFSDNLSRCLLGIFEVFYAIPYEEISVLSINGMIYICRFIFVSTILYCVIFYLRKLLTNPRYINSILMIAFSNIFILILTYTKYGAETFEYRYHLIWLIPTLILLVIRLNELIKDNSSNMQMFVGVCFIALIAIIATNSWYNVFISINNYNILEKVAEKVETVHPSGTVFCIGSEFHEIQDSHILRLIGQKNEYLFVKSDKNEIRFFNNYKKLLDNASYSQKNVILARPNEIDKLPNYIRKGYQLKDKEYIYNIYVANENKLDYVSGFPIEDFSRDFPYSPGYVYYNAKLNEEGYLETNGEESIVLKSPVLIAEELGSYDIKLNYECNQEKSSNIGNFKLYINDKLIMQKGIFSEQNSVILNNVQINDLKDKIKLEVFNCKDTSMILKNIEIYNKKSR